MDIKKALNVLNIPPFVTKAEIKKRYKELAYSYHPDRSDDSEKMAEINLAYETIMEYIDNYRYSFDSDEIAKQLPDVSHSTNFRP